MAPVTARALSLDEDGCLVIPVFFDPGRLARVNRELDLFFSAPSFNGLFYATVRDRHVSSVTLPTLLRSMNVLEVAVDVVEALQGASPGFDRRDYFVMNIEVYSEKGNPKALAWHTDNTEGMITAQVYLRGGGPTSGALLYMRGTHRRDFHVSHWLDAARVAELGDRIVSCGGAEGDMAVFNPMGFHARSACVQERRILRIEMRRRDIPYDVLKSFFPSHCLSPRVVEDIRLFSNHDPERAYFLKHGADILERLPARPLTRRLLNLAALLHVYRERLPRFLRRW